MPAAARFLDATNHPGLIVKGSTNVFINFLPAARATDTHACLMPPLAGPHPSNPIAQGSKTVLINNLPAARQLDKTGCGAAIVSGSANVLIGG
ncbi:MAG: PAAR domain-containing protein [Sulfurifustis sp.]